MAKDETLAAGDPSTVIHNPPIPRTVPDTARQTHRPSTGLSTLRASLLQAYKPAKRKDQVEEVERQ